MIRGQLSIFGTPSKVHSAVGFARQMGSGSGRSPMHENKKSPNCAMFNLHRTCTNSSNHHCWALGPIHRLGFAAAALFCWVAYAAADSFPSPAPPAKSLYLNSSLRISAPQDKRRQSPQRPHTWPRRRTKQNSNFAHRDAIPSLTPFIRIYLQQKGRVYGTVEVAKRRSL